MPATYWSQLEVPGTLTVATSKRRHIPTFCPSGCYVRRQTSAGPRHTQHGVGGVVYGLVSSSIVSQGVVNDHDGRVMVQQAQAERGAQTGSHPNQAQPDQIYRVGPPTAVL